MVGEGLGGMFGGPGLCLCMALSLCEFSTAGAKGHSSNVGGSEFGVVDIIFCYSTGTVRGLEPFADNSFVREAERIN